MSDSYTNFFKTFVHKLITKHYLKYFYSISIEECNTFQSVARLLNNKGTLTITTILLKRILEDDYQESNTRQFLSCFMKINKFCNIYRF